MQVIGSKPTVVALTMLALGEYGNITPTSTNSAKSIHFQGIISSY